MNDGEAAVIHCAAGVGRTGMVSTHLLTRMSMPFEQAIESIRVARSGAENSDQQQFLQEQGRA